MQVLTRSDWKQQRKGGDNVFPIISQWGVYVAMETSFDPICHKILSSLSPTLSLTLHIKFDQGRPTGLRYIQVQKCGRRRTTDHWYTIQVQLVSLRTSWAKIYWREIIIIITLEDNIYGASASLTYGPELHYVCCENLKYLQYIQSRWGLRTSSMLWAGYHSQFFSVGGG